MNNAARNERIKITATWFKGASVTALACAVVCPAIATQGAAAQTGNTDKSVRRWVNRDAESKKNFIYGLAEGISKNIQIFAYRKSLSVSKTRQTFQQNGMMISAQASEIVLSARKPVETAKPA